MYGFNRCERERGHPWVMSLNILGRGKIGKGAMRTDMVVNPLPLDQGQIEGGEVIIELIDSISLEKK